MKWLADKEDFSPTPETLIDRWACRRGQLHRIQKHHQGRQVATKSTGIAPKE
jgi:hypothetical protein